MIPRIVDRRRLRVQHVVREHGARMIVIAKVIEQQKPDSSALPIIPSRRPESADFFISHKIYNVPAPEVAGLLPCNAHPPKRHERLPCSA
jgi:hypothetical protein